MNIADLVFLYAAQEKSISKAAARAFVSQQCASKHIQNLENRYGVPLLHRRPHFALTDPGQELFRALQQIYLLESGVAGRIAELSGGSIGAFTLGINASRARWLLPAVLRQHRGFYAWHQCQPRTLAAAGRAAGISPAISSCAYLDPQRRHRPSGPAAFAGRSGSDRGRKLPGGAAFSCYAADRGIRIFCSSTAAFAALSPRFKPTGHRSFAGADQPFAAVPEPSGQHPERSFGPLRRAAQHPPAMRCFHQRLRRTACPVPGWGMRFFLSGFSFAAGRSRPQPAHFYGAGAAGAASH